MHLFVLPRNRLLTNRSPYCIEIPHTFIHLLLNIQRPYIIDVLSTICSTLRTRIKSGNSRGLVGTTLRRRVYHYRRYCHPFPRRTIVNGCDPPNTWTCAFSALLYVCVVSSSPVLLLRASSQKNKEAKKEEQHIKTVASSCGCPHHRCWKEWKCYLSHVAWPPSFGRDCS